MKREKVEEGSEKNNEIMKERIIKLETKKKR